MLCLADECQSPHCLFASTTLLFSFLSLQMSSKNHAASRSATQWVTWAHGEGFVDIAEHAPGSVPMPGVCSSGAAFSFTFKCRQGVLHTVCNVDCGKCKCIEATLPGVLVWQR